MKKHGLFLLTTICLFLWLPFSTSHAQQKAALPSLKDFYTDYFDFGSALSNAELRNTDRLSLYLSQYSIITPENELKPENVLDLYNSAKVSKNSQGSIALQFNTVKPLLEFAKANGLKVHGHVLFWHSQTPDEYFRESYCRTQPYVTREILLERMENHVRITMEYMAANYPGLIVSWDVVNEAIDDTTGKYRESNFTRIIGDDFVLQAFRFTRHYAPEGTLLFYNDYSTPYQPKLNGILQLLAALQAEGLVDGHGMQCHYQLSTPTVSQINLALYKITEMGLKVRVSELDILVEDQTDAQFALQSKRYGSIMKVLLSYAESVVAVQTWGTFDSLSWKSDHYPLLFQGDGTPKPAFYALTNPAILP